MQVGENPLNYSLPWDTKETCRQRSRNYYSRLIELCITHRIQQYLRGVARFNRFNPAARAALVSVLYRVRECDTTVTERPAPINMVTTHDAGELYWVVYRLLKI